LQRRRIDCSIKLICLGKILEYEEAAPVHYVYASLEAGLILAEEMPARLRLRYNILASRKNSSSGNVFELVSAIDALLIVHEKL
jgi:hypothetical protein